MIEDPGILCFQHCRKDVKVFCFTLPATCSVCSANLHESELRIPPFRVPYPFRSAKRTSNSIVIKPTKGDFLHNYQNSEDLHIGVTNSKGNVYEYDADGLRISSGQEWAQCLPVNIKEKADATWKKYWDYTLHIVCQQDMWSAERYDKEMHNCYSFVLAFLRTLQLPELKSCLTDKTQFCRDFIVPHTRVAAKYIALYRDLSLNGVKLQ